MPNLKQSTWGDSRKVINDSFEAIKAYLIKRARNPIIIKYMSGDLKVEPLNPEGDMLHLVINMQVTPDHRYDKSKVRTFIDRLVGEEDEDPE